MRAFALEGFDAQPALRDDVPEPSVGGGEVLVRVRASSVNPVDVFIASGGLKEMAEHEFPVTLGRDFAGVVEEAGPGVSRYSTGDSVFGFVPHASPNVRALEQAGEALQALPAEHTQGKLGLTIA